MNLLEDCTLVRLDSSYDLSSFDCDNADLNEFLQNDAIPYERDLMGVTYLFTLDKSPEQIVCFFTVSNDGLKVDTLYRSLKKRINKTVPRNKHMRVYPAVKIGRLGVSKDYNGQGVGSQLMDFIKWWFIDNNKTGCRFIIVDAYNEKPVLNYYEKNDFQFLMPSEKEAEEFNMKQEELKTRIMYFDLSSLLEGS